jgi:hypothetical protein
MPGKQSEIPPFENRKGRGSLICGSAQFKKGRASLPGAPSFRVLCGRVGCTDLVLILQDCLHSDHREMRISAARHKNKKGGAKAPPDVNALSLESLYVLRLKALRPLD